MEFVATCLFGLESLLGEEITDLGYTRTETMDGRVTFTADESAFARANINLRFAERVFLKIGSFPARTFEELFSGTKSLPWETWIGKKDAFPVKGHAIKSTLFSVPDCQRIIKKAVVERLKEQYGISWFEETGVKYQIEFFLFKDVATLMIDTSGVALHKRGYRPVSNGAPLRETLAAALVKMARPRENVVLWDPFCGSGTIAIEAALMMTHRAPGLRRSFAAESFPWLSKTVWQAARDEAESNIVETEFQAFASDIDPACVELTTANAKRAGVGSIIRTFVKDALTIETGGLRGTVVCNPPYGERLSSIREAEELYRQMGKNWMRLDRWQIYVLTSHEQFQSLYGRRADKVRKLYNGMLPCHYYQFFKSPAPLGNRK